MADHSGFERRFRRNRMAVAGLVVLIVMVGVAALAPFVAPHDPVKQTEPATERLRPPSIEHAMGTDRFGRDVLTRIIFGARVSLAVALIAVLLAAILGTAVGALSGYVGGRWDDVIMRAVDGLLAFPRLIFVLTLLAFFASSPAAVVLLLAATGWMGIARIVRAQILSLKERDFVRAAVATGAGSVHIVLKHLIPGVLGSVAVAATLRVGAMILLESYLSFLGLGVQPPTPSWGVMVADGRDVLASAWWVSAFPGLAIVIAVVSCNLVGDGLRDALDVKGG